MKTDLVNKKGYVTTSVALSVMFLSLFMLAFFSMSIRSHNVQIKMTRLNTERYTQVRSAYERLPGVFEDDFYTDSVIRFNDLPVMFYLTETHANNHQRTLDVISVYDRGDEIDTLNTFKLTATRSGNNHHEQIDVSISELTME